MKYLYLFLLIIFSIYYSVVKYSSILSIIFSSILIIFFIGSILYKNKCIINKKNILLSIISSVILLSFMGPFMFYKNSIKSITIENISDKTIVIESIYKDERLVKTNHKYNKKYDLINDSLEIEYKKYNKIDSSYKLTLNSNEKYKIDIDKVRNIEIDFQKKGYNYDVLINDKEISINSFAYPKNKKASKIYNSAYKYKFDNIEKDNNIIINVLFSIVLLFIFFNISLYAFSSRSGIMKLLFITIIELNPIIKITIFTKFILSIILLFLLKSSFKNNKWNTKREFIYLFGSILISFSFIGDRLINDKISFLLILLTLIILLFIYLLFPYFIDIIGSVKVKKNKSIKNITKHRLIVFIITLGICFLYHYIFNPYIVQADGYMELYDVENNILSNWHPYLHSLLLRIFKDVFGNVIFFLYFRFIIYCLVINSILFYLNKKGLRLIIVYLIAILFTIFPINGVMIVTLVKDIDFSIALVALTFYIYLLIVDKKYFNSNRINYIYLLISIVLVALFRHNGIYISICVLCLLFIISYMRKSITIFIICILSVISIFIVNKPLYDYLEVEDAPKNFDIATMLHGISYLIVNNKSIDSSSYKYITSEVIPNKDILTSYDKYNIDLLLHYNDLDIRNKDINKSKIIKVYLKEFSKYPVYLIKDRLYGTDILWNVSEKDNVEVYKYSIKYDEFGTNYAKLLKAKQRFSPLYKIVNKILLFISDNELLNTIFFRFGIYFDLLIVMLVYLIHNDRKKICSLIPVIANIITLFIAMHHQSYRYVWVLQIIVVLELLLITQYDRKNKTCF